MTTIAAMIYKKANIKTLALLGPRGSFSCMAAGRLGRRFKKIYCASVAEILEMVDKGAHGLLPVKNKIVGEIKRIIRQLKKGNYMRLKTIRLPVRFVLAAGRKMDLRDIKTVYAVDVAKKQCGKFLKKHLQHVLYDTSADSVTKAITKIVQARGISARENGKSAVITSLRAAKNHKLKILDRGIEDKPGNWTEFVLIKKK